MNPKDPTPIAASTKSRPTSSGHHHQVLLDGTSIPMSITMTPPQHSDPMLARGSTRHAPKHVLSVLDIEDAIPGLLVHASGLKHAMGKEGTSDLAKGKTLGLLFEKPSTRTRISFEVGFKRLGGHVVVLDAEKTQLGRGESPHDTAQVMSRYLDALMVRTHDHEALTTLAASAQIPIVNGLDDVEHPCQTLADMLTIQEHFGHIDGKTIAFLGDCANNVATSLMLAAPMCGADIKMICPDGYAPSTQSYQQGHELAVRYGTQISVEHVNEKTLADVDVVMTDTWTSMGDEDQHDRRCKALAPYAVDAELMATAKDSAIFMHCLPAHYGQETTEAVAHGPQSVIFEQAENRMWAQMALLVHVLGLREQRHEDL